MIRSYFKIAWRSLFRNRTSAFINIGGLAAGMTVAVLIGVYPALYLSSFKPIKVLKGTFRAGRLAALPRKALVVMQFSISIALIICTLIVYNQIMFAKNRPVGYTRDGLILVQKKIG